MSSRDDSHSGRRARDLIRGALLALALALAATALNAVAAGAQGRDDRIIKEPPTVSGPAQVGATVTATGARWEPPSAPATWRWYSCATPQTPGDDVEDFEDRGCLEIDGAAGSSYTVSGDDEGRYLRVLLVVRRGNRWAWALSAPSAQVAAAPTPEPTPVPEPVAPPAPPAAPAAPAAPLAPAVPEGAVLPQAAVSPKLMKPTPLVRIRGRLSRRGARITLLTVEAPRGARIAIRCIGRGCPARRWAKTTAITRIARFQRDLRAGTKLVVTVTKPGRIGKHTTILIRDGKAPARRDRCLIPGSGRPVPCPSV